MTTKRVRGSKGGSAKPHTPYEMEDNLSSINKIKVLLAVSDGEVEGTFNRGMVLLNDVSVDNYPDVIVDFRPGTQTQSYIKGFTDTSSEITVNRNVTVSSPFTYSITNKVISATRIKILASRLINALDNGDRVGVKVNYKVEIAVDGAPFREVVNDNITGKNTTNGYDRSIRVDLPAFNNQILVRVSRVTPDSTSANLVDAFQVQSYAEVVDNKFRYPLTGLIYVEFDSKMFPSGIPTISTKKKWKIISIPSNYDPILRTYVGAWDGTFKRAWSNNPAWVLYDLIINQRYGLDQRELGIPVDKWSLYEVAQYCDQQVPDGKGGTEPRYFCDMVVQGQVEAYKLVRDVCSIFRGMSFWNGESLSIVIDKPRNPVYIFNNSNVVNGDFSYTFASEKSMYTSCNVTFDDEQNMYQQDIEPVFDYEASLRFGSNPTSITAIGCVRRSEANRRGRWILKTNLNSTVVNFATGLEGMIPMVGDVIAVADGFWQSNLDLTLSGRIVESAGLQVFLPYKIDARPGDYIMVNKPDGAPVKRTISSITPDGKTVTLNLGFGFTPQPDTAFLIERTDIAPQLYVVASVKKGDGDDEFTFQISGVQYDPNKFDEVDLGVNIDDRPTSVINPDVLEKPTGVVVDSYSRIVQGLSVETMVVGWNKQQYATYYEMQWRKDDGNWNNVPQTVANEVEVEGIYSGSYFVRVRAISSTGTSSQWSDIVSKQLTGKVGEPGPPINLIATTNEVFGIRVRWGFSPGSGDTAYTELQQSLTGKEDDATLLTMVPYPSYEYWHSILPAGFVNYYRVRTVDRIGNVSAWTTFARGMSTDDLDAIGEVVKIDIENSEVFKDLAESAASSAAKLKEQAQTDLQNALANDADVKWTRKENGKRKAEFGYAVQLIANETEARTTEIKILKAEIDENISAKITELNEALATETETRAKQVGEIKVQFEDVGANISRLDQAIATETEARAESIRQMDAKVDKTITDLDGTTKRVTLAEANITETQKAIANESEARAAAIQALTARVGNNEAALVTKLDSWVTPSGIGASATIKLGVKYNGVEYTAGQGMSLEQVGGRIFAQTIFDVDRFAIGRIEGGKVATLPFYMENNQVFVNSLVVKDGSITNAKIGNTIQSNNFQAGLVGWRLDKGGNFENNGSTPGQGRMTMTNTQISVYDQNGVLRARMGQL